MTRRLVIELIEEPPGPVRATWGTSARAQRAYRAAELDAGGPAPMRQR